MSGITKTPANLKKHICHLINIVYCQEKCLEIRKRCLIDLNHHLDPVVIAITEDITELKRRGREAVFDLLISGISHREFMRFIKELDQ